MMASPLDEQTKDEQSLRYAMQHMARDVWQVVIARQAICRACRHPHTMDLRQLFVQCGGRFVSLAGDKCPQHRW